jgi:hypothetical protein
LWCVSINGAKNQFLKAPGPLSKCDIGMAGVRRNTTCRYIGKKFTQYGILGMQTPNEYIMA